MNGPAKSRTVVLLPLRIYATAASDASQGGSRISCLSAASIASGALRAGFHGDHDPSTASSRKQFQQGTCLLLQAYGRICPAVPSEIPSSNERHLLMPGPVQVVVQPYGGRFSGPPVES